MTVSRTIYQCPECGEEWSKPHCPKCAEDQEPNSAALPGQLEAARQLLEAIHRQLESPSRNTTMTSYRRDGSVIISTDIRQRVAAWLNANPKP